MLTWENRVVEEANLFNPAFCAMLLAQTADDYKKKLKTPLPFPLAFLILPIVLHGATRKALPASTITSLLSWSQDNRERLVDFPSKVQRLREITRDALLFGAQHEIIFIDTDANISVGAKRQSPTEKRTELFTDEARECLDRAGFIGRWFSGAGTEATIYAALGISP